MSIRIVNLHLAYHESARLWPGAWKAFKLHMRGRPYGRNELSDAWGFFLAGYKALWAQRPE